MADFKSRQGLGEALGGKWHGLRNLGRLLDNLRAIIGGFFGGDRVSLSPTTSVNLRFGWLQQAGAGLFVVFNELEDRAALLGAETERTVIVKYSRLMDLFRRSQSRSALVDVARCDPRVDRRLLKLPEAIPELIGAC